MCNDDYEILRDKFEELTGEHESLVSLVDVGVCGCFRSLFACNFPTLSVKSVRIDSRGVRISFAGSVTLSVLTNVGILFHSRDVTVASEGGFLVFVVGLPSS